MAETNVLVISHNSFGEMELLINKKRYSYIGVDPFNVRKIEGFIKYRNWKSLFPFLKNFTKEKRNE